MTVTKAKAENTSTEWATPKALFDKLNKRFNFTLDPCATIENAKCEKFYTKEDDGLKHSWRGERVFMNPPYGKEAPEWVEKAYIESDKHEIIVACLIVPRSDTVWWHRWVSGASELWFLQGRVKFENPVNPGQSPQDPSCIVLFHPDGNDRGSPQLHFWDWKNEDCPKL